MFQKKGNAVLMQMDLGMQNQPHHCRGKKKWHHHKACAYETVGFLDHLFFWTMKINTNMVSSECKMTCFCSLTKTMIYSVQEHDFDLSKPLMMLTVAGCVPQFYRIQCNLNCFYPPKLVDLFFSVWYELFGGAQFCGN